MLAVLLWTAGGRARALPDPVCATLEEQLRHLDTAALDEWLESLDQEVRRQLPVRSVREVVLDPAGGLRLDPAALARDWLQYLVGEVIVQSRRLAQQIGRASCRERDETLVGE